MTTLCLDVKVKESLEWDIFARLLSILGITGEPNDILISGRQYDLEKELLEIVSKKDVVRLLSFIPKLEPQCMLKYLQGKEDYSTFRAYYQAGAFLKKFPYQTNLAKQAAYKKFYAAEQTCKIWNEQNIKALLTLDKKHPFFYGIVDDLRRDISKLLGKADFNLIVENARHGPGTTVEGADDGKVTRFYKMSDLPYSVSADCYTLAQEVISTDQRWIGALNDWYRRKCNLSYQEPINMNHFWSHVLMVIDYNRVTTVPKTALTDRVIAIEPKMNVYLQLGIDGIVKKRLRKRWHYDLQSQELNQKLALEGSIADNFATLDLKAASDTVPKKLVWILLPEDWLYFFECMRMQTGKIDKNFVEYEKYSSMGNGYTFCLESLIFGAIVRWCYRKIFGTFPKFGDTAVYGDDIIVPKECAALTVQVLSLCGFSLNMDKSFITGPFRESCGKDYFHGWDVRPIFLKRPLKTVVDFYYVHNALRLYNRRALWHSRLSLSPLYKFIRMRVPRDFRIYGPFTENTDTHFFSCKREYLNIDLIGRRVTFDMISCRPRVYKRKSKDFLFIKLMADLRILPENPYSLDTTVGGNIFDITRRHRILYKLRRGTIWF